MNKDAILATIIGFGVGLVITGTVFLGPTVAKQIHVNLSSLSMPNVLNPAPQKKKAAVTPKPAPKTLSIDSPLDQSTEPKGDLLISGSAPPNATIVLEGENNEAVVIATPKGIYAGKLTLGEGKNTLKVTSYSGKDVQSKTVTVFYTAESY